ncbi:MAG: hypothetical protein ACYDD1_02890 [Caulobacteraceae bacterium]
MAFHPVFDGLPPRGSPAFDDLCGFCGEHRQQVLCALPWLAAEIAGNEGFASMFAFVRRHGGARLHVSAHLEQFKAKATIDLSERTYRHIVQNAGVGALIDVPSAWGIFLALRRVAISQALAEGAHKRAVARRFGVSERSLRKPPQSRSRPELFRSSHPSDGGSN